MAALAQPLTDKICKKAKKDCAEAFDAPGCDANFAVCKQLQQGGGALRDYLAKIVEPAHVTRMLADNAYRKATLRRISLPAE